VTPKPDTMAFGVVAAAEIGKIDRHV
jgi:hypothetical protein